MAHLMVALSIVLYAAFITSLNHCLKCTGTQIPRNRHSTVALRLSANDFTVITSTASSDITALQPYLASFKKAFDVTVNFLSVCLVFRTILSWYPGKDLRKLPYSLVVWPTESLLRPVRKLVPPAFGVDISTIIWIMILSFLHEILTGQQGVVTMLLKK